MGRASHMIMEVGIRDRHPLRRVDHIDQAVVVVFAVVNVGRYVARVDPHVRRCLHRDPVSVVRLHLGNLHVPHNDVLLTEDREANTR